MAGASGGGAAPDAKGPEAKGGGGMDGLAALLPQLEGVMSALKALVEKLGGGAAAAVAGATGDATGGGPAKDAKSGVAQVAGDSGPGQFPMQVPPSKVAGDQGPGQIPTQVPPSKVAGDSGPGKVEQAPTKVAGDSGPGQFPTQKPVQTGVGGVFGFDDKRGFGHVLRRGVGHHRHMGPFEFPGQFPGQFVPGKPAQVAGAEGAGIVQVPAKDVPVKGEPAQVGGASGSGKDVPVQAPVKDVPTQVGGDSGKGKDDPVQSVPVQSPPVSQVGGSTGSEPKAPEVPTQSPSQSEPVQAPVKQSPVGDVKLLELDALNQMQLLAQDGSYLFFQGTSASYRTKSGIIRDVELPTSGFSMTLSDGTKFSYGINDKAAWGEEAGTPRDIEILGANGDLMAARTDDGDDNSWTETPLSAFNLLEVASMLFDGSYSKFGGSGEVVQQSGNVVQQTATK